MFGLAMTSFCVYCLRYMCYCVTLLLILYHWKRLPGKTCFRNDLLCIDYDVKPYKLNWNRLEFTSEHLALCYQQLYVLQSLWCYCL